MIIRTALISTTLAAFLLSAVSPLHAASFVNRESDAVTVRIIGPDGEAEHTIAPLERLTGVCEDGCLVILNDSKTDEFALDGLENLSIERGNLYFEGPDPEPSTNERSSEPPVVEDESQ